MAELLICSQSTRVDSLLNQCGINSSDIYGIGNFSASLHPYRPYLVGKYPNDNDLCILNQFGSPLISQNLAEIALSVGNENIHGLAEVHHQLSHQEHEKHHHSVFHYAQEGTEKIAGVVKERSHIFKHSVKHYEEALIKYRGVLKSTSASQVDKLHARLHAKEAFDHVQRAFGNEIKLASSRRIPAKGATLTNFTRAANVAKSSRTAVKLEVTNQAEAIKLSNLGKNAGRAGAGLVVLDFGTRAADVYSAYEEGGDWERKMFKESATFAAGAITGELAVYGMTLLLASTPVGWIGLVVVAGVALAASASTAGYVSDHADNLYDSALRFIGVK